MEEEQIVEFKDTPLTISTCTVLCNLNKRLDLELITRFVPVYELFANELNEKSGGIYNIEFYGNCARGETLSDKINEMFNNQTTIKFKYWGFRMVNIKIFRNGRLQMTGLKYEGEAAILAGLLIDIISHVSIPINLTLEDIICSSRTFDMQVLYNTTTKKITYYRRYYKKFLNAYQFDLEKFYYDYKIKKNKIISNTQSKSQNDIHNNIHNNIHNEKQNISNKDSIYKQISIDLKGKNFRKDLHDVYMDDIDDGNDSNDSNLELLESNDWYGDMKILKIIDMLDFVKEYVGIQIENILSSSSNLKDLKQNINKFQMDVLDFRNPELMSILDNIASDFYPLNEQTLIEVKSQIHSILKQYKSLMMKKITRMIFIRNSDVSICHMLEEYLLKNPNILAEKLDSNTITKNNNDKDIKQEHEVEHDKKIKINIHNLMNNDCQSETGTKTNNDSVSCGTEKTTLNTDSRDSKLKDNEIINNNLYGYYISGTETVMINSDLSVNYNINLKKMAKILNKKNLFNTYDPDEHSGVNLKYYWNKLNNNDEGICHCTPHCSTKDKKSICNKITILIFRPGSIVITGSRTLEQLYAAHTFTIKLLKETMNTVRIDEKTDDTKQLALLNNEARKISRKPRLFYVEKKNIINNYKIILK